MNIEELLKDKSKKPKEKTTILSEWLINEELAVDELLAFAENAKDPAKATCIEAIEYATINNANIGTEDVLAFVTHNLKAKAPRVKWESAKVIANIIFLFPNNIDEIIKNLLENTNHVGTVVRWSAATALGEILKLETKHNETLLPIIKDIIEKEEKNSIKKIYLKAVKLVLV